LFSFNVQTPLNLGARNGSVPILELQMTPDNWNLQGHAMGSSNQRVMGTKDWKLWNKTVRISNRFIIEKKQNWNDASQTNQIKTDLKEIKQDKTKHQNTKVLD